VTKTWKNTRCNPAASIGRDPVVVKVRSGTRRREILARSRNVVARRRVPAESAARNSPLHTYNIRAFADFINAPTWFWQDTPILVFCQESTYGFFQNFILLILARNVFRPIPQDSPDEARNEACWKGSEWKTTCSVATSSMRRRPNSCESFHAGQSSVSVPAYDFSVLHRGCLRYRHGQR
jgi:hypothetical protein